MVLFRIEILETRLYQTGMTQIQNTPTLDTSVSFIDEVAAATPAPGGGSAAAYAGALGAGLAEMVAGLTLGKKKYVEVEAEMQAVHVQAELLRKEFNQRG